MELRQLEHFVAVAEERHFTRAAQRVHIVQSGLSASIRALEQELGVTLFERTRRSVELTEPGRALLGEARRVLAAVRSARDAISDVQGLVNGRVGIGTEQALPPVLNLPRVLGAFHSAYPGVDIHLCQNRPAQLLEEVAHGELDLAFVALAGSPPMDLYTILLWEEDLVLLCPAPHPLAAQAEVALSELAGQAFIDLKTTWTTRQLVDTAFAATRVARNTRIEVNDIHSLLDLVANGLGLALVPRSLAELGKNTRWAPLSGPLPSWKLALVTLRSEFTNPAARAFLTLLAREVPDILLFSEPEGLPQRWPEALDIRGANVPI